MTDSLHYVSDTLDRDPQFRAVPLEQLLSNPLSRVFPLWRSRNLFEVTVSETRVVTYHPEELPLSNDSLMFLGYHEDAPLFTIDYSKVEVNALDWLQPDHQFQEVRKLISLLSNEEASLLAYARGMMTWHRNHAYCGKCGSATASQSNGHERKCTNPTCGKVAYPRVDPAVIVLLEHTFDGTEKCLLGRTSRYPDGMYSTLAGFVEPGESLEMTVRREMKEEVGLEVGNIRYIASQPWPFPTSLMLGFFATALSTRIELDTNEVTEARWFSKQELKKLSNKGEIELSRVDSIARYLITTWLNQD